VIEAPFGTWPSSISAEHLTTGVVGLVDVWVDGDRTIWQESRPSEGGRQVLVVLDADGTVRDLIDAPFNARSAVHEYGGGAAWVERGVAWFVNWDDQRIWRVSLDGGEPMPLTAVPATPRSVRYADLRLSADGRWLTAVQEHHGEHHGQHQPDGSHAVANRVVVLSADDGGEPTIVHDGTDFAMSPRFVAPDRLRCIGWQHPNMPWNDTTLFECTFDPASGRAGEPTAIATGASFMQPVGDVVISDRDGVWNLWSIEADGTSRQLTTGASEIGGPAWVFGLRDHVVLDDGRRAWTIDGDLVVDGVVHATGAAELAQLTPAPGGVTAIAHWTDRPSSITRFELTDAGTTDIVPSPPIPVGPADISVARHIEYPTTEGATAYGWFSPPVSSAVTAPAASLPPLIVMIHGGPTAQARPWFSLASQFWTTRGFAIVDVDHRGSTGYGTAYRNLLDGRWGEVDVDDCIAAATHLADEGLVDRDRMVIRGGSAGGFTVLGSLVRSDVFAAGACSYGIADLSVLAADTHKFESRYADRLIGPWPEARDVYEARSPIHHLDRFDTPLIVFQGLDDKVVPPNQSEMIVAALRERGIECEYHAFAGEGHGFRRADTIVARMNAELAFYRRILDLHV
jgi:dipeptidyl aminopeptidase/acylaminoacyl peptidase